MSDLPGCSDLRYRAQRAATREAMQDAFVALTGGASAVPLSLPSTALVAAAVVPST